MEADTRSSVCSGLSSVCGSRPLSSVYHPQVNGQVNTPKRWVLGISLRLTPCSFYRLDELLNSARSAARREATERPYATADTSRPGRFG